MCERSKTNNWRNEINPIWSCHSQLWKKRNVSLIKNKIKIMSFHFLCFISVFFQSHVWHINKSALADYPASVLWQRYPRPSPSRVPVHVSGESSSSSKGAGESPSSPKGAGESQVSREHCKSESRVVKADRSQGSIAMSLKGHLTVWFTRVRMSDCITIIACRQNHFQLNLFFIIWFLNKLWILCPLKTQLNLHKRLLQLSSTWTKKTLTF